MSHSLPCERRKYFLPQLNPKEMGLCHIERSKTCSWRISWGCVILVLIVFIQLEDPCLLLMLRISRSRWDEFPKDSSFSPSDTSLGCETEILLAHTPCLYCAKEATADSCGVPRTNLKVNRLSVGFIDLFIMCFMYLTHTERVEGGYW